MSEIETTEHTMFFTRDELPTMMPVILAQMWAPLKKATRSMEYRLKNCGVGLTEITIVCEFDVSTAEGRNQKALTEDLIKTYERSYAS